MKRPPPKKRIIQDFVELRSRSHDPRIDPQATQKISRQELDAVLRRASGVRPRVERPRTDPPASMDPEPEPAQSAGPEPAAEAAAERAEVAIEPHEPLHKPTPLNPQVIVASPRRRHPKRFVVLSVTVAVVVATLIGVIGFVLGRASH